MTKTTIKLDSIGLFCYVSSTCCRLIGGTTRFKPGDKVDSYHFGGYAIAGIGKDDSCAKGQYLERWTSVGPDRETYKQWYEAGTLDDELKRLYSSELIKAAYGDVLNNDPTTIVSVEEWMNRHR